MTTIKTDVSSIWRAYAGSAQSGRFQCPIVIVSHGHQTRVTHIYRGYGQTRLEHIVGEPRQRKGFQGDDVTPLSAQFSILD